MLYAKSNSLGDAIICIAIGTAMFTLAFTGHKFYWAKPYFAGTKEMPLWLGRALFIFVGTGFLLFGIRYFVLGY